MDLKNSNSGWIIIITMKVMFAIALLMLMWYLIIPNTSIYYMNKTLLPFFHKLNERDLIMVPGEEYKLRVERLNTRVEFSSLDIKVAVVTPFGNIIGLRPGKTFIRAKYNDNELRCRVRVIKLNKKEIELEVEESFDLDIKGPMILKKVSWSSNNERVVIVNNFGKVKGISRGKATVIGKIGDQKLKCSVLVK